MDAVGTNPARIIPAWRAFVDEHAGKRPFRGIGEPIWAGRSADELVECQRHEALLNLAFAETAGFELLCPYDTEALGPDVIEEAHRSYPFIVESGAHAGSTGYQGLDTVGAPFRRPSGRPAPSFQRPRQRARAVAGQSALRADPDPILGRRHGGPAAHAPPLTAASVS